MRCLPCSWKTISFVGTLATVFGFLLMSPAVLTGCQSNVSKSEGPSSIDGNRGAPESSSADGADGTSYAPGAQNFRRESLPGTAFTLDENKTTAQVLVLTGDSRRPVFVDNHLLTFAKRRTDSDRWQVFETDLKRQYERRISFDAGDSEPIASLGRRLIVATSSQTVKSSDRVLDEYRSRFVTPEPNREPRSENSDAAKINESWNRRPSLHHILIESPAKSRRGVEWVPMSKDPSSDWTVSFDSEMKSGIAIMKTANPAADSDAASRPLIYRITRRHQPTRHSTESRIWEPLRVQSPSSEGASVTPLDGRIFPDGRRVLWNRGSLLWTTNLVGQDAQKFGETLDAEIETLAIDPLGAWIVFSTSVSGEGLNLMAVHSSGKCLHALTEMNGDETDPAFSPDGQTLAFTVRSKDQKSRIALISLERKENGSPACTEK